MSKLSIRPRNLDACKFIPIYKCEEIPDLNDYASINRSIPQLPTGMEKEEESEHHLQQAISAQQSKGTTGELVIPTPEVFDAPESFYNDLYPLNYKLPRQLIHVQPFAIEHDIPDYDRDSEDELWLEKQKDFLNLTPLKFEEMIDRFEKNSNQHVISIKEAKLLLKEDEDLIIAVFDYWLNKRLRLQTPLIPLVKTERRDATANNSNNPYIAFRRRTEKMQTRKNRKNDEISYEKMLKLRRDLSRAVNLLQLIKQREKTKIDHVKLTVDIFEKRYQIGDFNGNIINEINAQRQIRPAPNYIPLNNILKTNENKPPRTKEDTAPPRKKREYKKRHRPETIQRTSDQPDTHDYVYTSDEDEINGNLSQPASDQDEDDSDGPYSFKRKKGCQYHAPLSDPFGNWPFYSAEELASNNNKYKYCLTELRRGNGKRLEYTRKRIGRGGRIIFDRAFSYNNKSSDEFLSIDVNTDSDSEKLNYFRPKSPAECTYSDSPDEDDFNNEHHYNEDEKLVQTVPSNVNDFLYEDDNVFANGKSGSIYEAEKFKLHQDELVKVQKKQIEKLRGNELAISSSSSNSSNSSSSSNNNNSNNNSQRLNNLDNSGKDSICNSEHSLNKSSFTNNCNSLPIPSSSSSITINNSSTISASSVMPNNIQPSNTTTIIPQPSLLDPESVQFAVSAVLSTSELSGIMNNNSLCLVSPPASIASSAITNTSSNTKESLASASVYTVLTNDPSSAPVDFNMYANFSEHSPSPSNSAQKWQNSPQKELTTNSSSSNVCKLKYQNNNQNSISSVDSKLTATDVT